MGLQLFGLGVRVTVDDINPGLPYKDPKLWEFWHIPDYGECRFYITNRRI